MSDDPTVIFIGGYGRSGSTLLSQLLGRHAEVFPTGELRHIWRRGFGDDQLCGCGERFRTCEFWRAVRSKVDESLESGWAATAAALQDSVDRARFVPLLINPSLRTPSFRSRLGEYLTVVESIYSAIATVSGCRVIVDSSKDPSHGFLLSTSRRLELKVLHLVRDSRAVAYSWKRRKPRPEVHDPGAEMPRLSPVRSALEWNFYNLMAELLGSRADYVRVRYEELAERPRAVLGDLCRRFGLDPVPRLEGSSFVAGSSHSVSGNPVRFETGRVTITKDVEWENRMTRRDHLTATVLTWPLLRRYAGE